MSRIRRTSVVAVTLITGMLLLFPAAGAVEDDSSDGDQFLIEFTLYADGGGELHNISVAEGTPTNLVPFEYGEPTHELVILSADGEELVSQEARIDFTAYPTPTDPVDHIEPFEVEERSFHWRFPHDTDAQNITMYEYPDVDPHPDRTTPHTVGMDDDRERTVVFTVDLDDDDVLTEDVLAAEEADDATGVATDQMYSFFAIVSQLDAYLE